MLRWFRRIITLSAVSGAGATIFRFVRRRRLRSPEASTEWPPFTPSPTRESTTHAAAETFATSAAGPASEPASSASASSAAPIVTAMPNAEQAAPAPRRAWADPVDGACPEGFPVKGNASSKIFHVPGGRSYDRTIPERCYATPQDAIADGFRAAKA